MAAELPELITTASPRQMNVLLDLFSLSVHNANTRRSRLDNNRATGAIKPLATSIMTQVSCLPANARGAATQPGARHALTRDLMVVSIDVAALALEADALELVTFDAQEVNLGW